MLDFFMVSTRSPKKDLVEVYPRFLMKKSSDLMIRGGDFYAIWVEERGLWSTDEDDVIDLIDRELDNYVKENRNKYPEEAKIKVLRMIDAESGIIDKWHKYCQKQRRDCFHMLDEKIIFSNMETSKKDYASKRLSYPLEDCDISAYEKIISTLYDEEERHKLEWAIGSIVSGDSKELQKFIVLYGDSGTGKSTILNIIQLLFDGYYTTFSAKQLGQANNVFALEAFKTNPLVAIEHDGDLSKIEDNTRLNSLVSHEIMSVNEKFKSAYDNRFKCFLFMGTNKPVKITDAKSGLIRRLIDVSPSGRKLSVREYRTAVKQVRFELGGIAKHCLEVYESDPDKYNDYIPIKMIGASNDFYNFVMDSYYVFKKDDGVTLKAAYEMYKVYCEEAKVSYPMSRRLFKEELKNYFRDCTDRATVNGDRARNYYSGFKTDKFEIKDDGGDELDTKNILEYKFAEELKEQPSLLDEMLKDCPAQYAKDDGTPAKKWENVKTTLADLDTSKLHYVKVPENHIIIDFDIPDENGEKSLERNIEEASKWPKTYTELSKSGKGIHLHYIYTGDPKELSRLYADHIEIKVSSGNASLRRKLTKCINYAIATIASGLPLKEVRKIVDANIIQNEKGIRSTIRKCLDREVHANTKPNIDFIYKILDDAYKKGVPYNVTDMRSSILAFAMKSTNQADKCLDLVSKMHFESENEGDPVDAEEDRIIFYDVEVFPNLFLVNWKIEGPDKSVIRWINPTSSKIEWLIKHKLVGFNCRRYDNHMIYACMIGYSVDAIYELSKSIISGDKNAFFGEAYNLSYTDVYDFSSKKQSLKKFEIELGIHHQELGLPWDQPVPEEMWNKVAEYCDNDVIATEAVFNDRKSDFTARQILADVAGATVNDTTNTLTTKIIFGTNKNPQDQFNYRNMSTFTIPFDMFNEDYEVFDEQGRPEFPGYEYKAGKSTYRGEEVGEGGYVYSEPGIHYNVALLDIASMHPSSIVAEELFGPIYTARFKEILDARLAIKHGDFDKARGMLDGKLAKYLDDKDAASDLAQALKIAINSVYGLTAAGFMNPFRDKRNVDNIVAKRGALFMVNLKHAVQEQGFTVAHIKTDSIKIPNATPEIIDFVMVYGQRYGYKFEHEATYNRMCLVNDAVYIAAYEKPEVCEQMYGYIPSDNAKHFKKHDHPWTATGTQFQVPYVFKTLFSHEPIEFDDKCETKSVSTAIFLDNENPNDPNNPYFVGRVGRFCPIKDGCGGSLLLRESKDKDGNVKYGAVTGSKGYHWLESEAVKDLDKENDIDESYYRKLVDEAVDVISKYGDFEEFQAGDSFGEAMNKPEVA